MSKRRPPKDEPETVDPMQAGAPVALEVLLAASELRAARLVQENQRLRTELLSIRADAERRAAEAAVEAALQHHTERQKHAKEVLGIDLADYHYDPGDACLRRNKPKGEPV